MRFLYCACAIATLLNDWSGVDIARATEYVLRCITYEGGIALIPGMLCVECFSSYRIYETCVWCGDVIALSIRLTHHILSSLVS